MFTSLRARLWFTYALLGAIILCVVGTGLLIYLVRNPPATARAYQQLQFIAAFHEAEIFHDLCQPLGYVERRVHVRASFSMGAPTRFPHSVQEPS